MFRQLILYHQNNKNLLIFLVETCMKKWSNLRDTFRTYLRNEKNIASGSAAHWNNKWHHFSSLLFLIPYIKMAKWVLFNIIFLFFFFSISVLIYSILPYY